MRTCNDCGSELTSANWRQGRRKRREYICGPCEVKRTTNYRHRIKFEVLLHYTQIFDSTATEPRCKCSFKNIDALSIDHTNNNGSEERAQMKRKQHKSGVGFYSLLKRLGYPEGYQTMCFNCQMVKRAQSGKLGSKSFYSHTTAPLMVTN